MKVLAQTTRQILARIAQIDFFSRVGTNSTSKIHVTTWEGVIKGLRSRKWCNLEEAVINFYNIVALKELRATNPASWDFVPEINSSLEPLAVRLWGVIAEKAGREAPYVHSEVIVHLRQICLEAQNPRELKLAFFTRHLLPIYEAGHMPCGWTGPAVNKGWIQTGVFSVPEGEVIVF